MFYSLVLLNFASTHFLENAVPLLKTMKLRLTILFITIITFGACSRLSHEPKTPLRFQTILELQAYVADTLNPKDSISHAILLTALKHNSAKEPEKGMAYIDSLYTQSHHAYDLYEPDIYICKAFLSIQRNAPDTTVMWLNKGLADIEKDMGHQMIIQRYACAAFICRMLYTPESVDMCYGICQRAMEYGQKHPDAEIISDIYNYLAWAQNYKGMFQESMKNTKKAIAISHKNNNNVQEAWSYTVLSYGFRQEHMEKLEMLTAKKAYQLAQRKNMLMEIDIFAARVMGWAYEDYQNKDSAIYYFKEAINVAECLGDPLCAAQISESDLRRVEENGCRQPDSLSIIRSTRLDLFTDQLIESGKLDLREKDFTPAIEREKRRFMLLMFSSIALIFALLIAIQLTYVYFKKYRRRMKKHIDDANGQLDIAQASLEEERGKLTHTSSRLQEAYALLQERQDDLYRLQEEQERKQNLIEELQRLHHRENFSLEDIQKDPRQFTKDFLADNPQFEANLKERLGNLSNHDALLCILIALRVSKEDAVNIFNIRMESMNVARHRLRSKLNLTRTDNLEQVLRSML